MLGLLGFLMPAGKVKGAVAIHLTLMDFNMEAQVVDPTLEAKPRSCSQRTLCLPEDHRPSTKLGY